MKKEKTLLDYIVISIIVLAIICMYASITSITSLNLMLFGLLALVISFIFLVPLSESYKKLKNGTLTLWNKIFLIVRAVVSAIIGVFLYNFIINDYNYWIANKNFLTILALFSLAFLTLDFFLHLIKAFRDKQKISESKFKPIGTLLLTLFNLYFLILPILNYYSPKKELTLPAIKKPKSISIYLKSSKDKDDLLFIKNEIEITDEKAINDICNAFSNSKIENWRNLDGIKFDLCKSGTYYSVVPKYDETIDVVNPTTFENLNSGYLTSMEILPDGETSIIAFNNDIHEKRSLNPFKLTKYGEFYKIKLPKKTVNHIVEAAKNK